MNILKLKIFTLFMILIVYGPLYDLMAGVLISLAYDVIKLNNSNEKSSKSVRHEPLLRNPCCESFISLFSSK